MDSEFQHLSRRLSGLAVRRIGFAFGLWGEAGIGKTHTTLALLRGAPCQSLSVHATQAFESIIGKLTRPKKASVWLERSLERIGRGEVPETEALIQTLAALLAANAPVILHVEDLHEASKERLEFWTQLALVVVWTRGVGLIATSRTEPPAGFEAVKLSALNRGSSDALLEAEAGASLPPEALGWVFERASGNPLFTLEFFRFLARQGFVWNDSHRWRWRVPEREVMPVTVEALIERMLREATGKPALENAVQAKAILGLGANDDLWAEVAELSPENLGAAKRELERHGILSRSEFAHPLYREVIVQNVPSERRRLFARRAIQALEGDPESAAQFMREAKLEPRAALELLGRAANLAKNAGNQVRAARFQARAVEYETGQRRARRAFEAALALEMTDPTEALRLARVAVGARPDDVETALYLASRLVTTRRQLSDADEVLERLPKEARHGNRWASWLIAAHKITGHYDAALEVWRAHPDLHDDLDPSTAVHIAGSLAQTGAFEEADALAERALRLEALTATQRAGLLNVQSIANALHNRPESAERCVVAAIAVARAHGLTLQLGMLLQNHSKNLERTERYDEAFRAAEESARAYAEAGDRLRWASATGQVAGHLIEFGRFERAEESLLEARAVLELVGPSPFLAANEMTLAVLHREWPSPYGPTLALKFARLAFEHALEIGQAKVTTYALAVLARTEAAAGDPKHAFERAARAVIAVGDATDESAFMARNALAAALEALGRPADALEALRESLGFAQRGGFALDVQRIGLEIDRLNGDASSAQERLAWFKARGLLNGVYIAHRYFPELATDASPGTALEHAVPSEVRLEILGEMQLRQAGVAKPLRGRKRKELLAVLLEARVRGRSEVSSLDLCDALYPGEPEEDALGALKATVFKIRSSLGANLISSTPNGYGLGLVASDAEDFLQTGNTGLWRGPYLEDAALEGRDENVREALYHALEAKARALLQTDPANPTEAARLGRIMLLAEPYDARALEITCRALWAKQNHKGLSRLYADARARMLEVGEVLPERWKDFLEAQPA